MLYLPNPSYRISPVSGNLAAPTLIGSRSGLQKTHPTVIVKRGGDGRLQDVTPKGFSVDSAVNEYGTRSFIVSNAVVFFSNYDDQEFIDSSRESIPSRLLPREVSGTAAKPTAKGLAGSSAFGKTTAPTRKSIPPANLWLWTLKREVSRRSCWLIPIFTVLLASVPRADCWQGSTGTTRICLGTVPKSWLQTLTKGSDWRANQGCRGNRRGHNSAGVVSHRPAVRHIRSHRLGQPVLLE